MKKSKYIFPLILLIVGIILAIGGFSDTMLIMKGKSLNMNTADQADFEEAAMIEGKIDFVYGPFATLTETESIYGIEKKKETNFYIIGNFDSETYMDAYNNGKEFDDFYIIFSTSNQTLSAMLDKTAEKWVSYLTGETDPNQLPPQTTITFSGRLCEQSYDDKYTRYRDEACSDLENIGISANQYATLRIAEGDVEKISLCLFFGGILIFLLGIFTLIFSIVSSRKEKKRKLDFINSQFQ